MQQTSTIDEAALPPLLDRFYGRVRADAELGPVFDGIVQDWSEHLGRLAAFWSSVMLTTGRYKGNPVVKHLVHGKRMTPAMFDRWIALWDETTSEMLSPAAAAAMQAKARRISESLQAAIRFQTPEQEKAVAAAHALSRPYKSTPVFDADTLPAELQRAHSTKAGVWGVIRVLEGMLCYHIEDGSVPPAVLTPTRPGLVRPQELHRVETVGAMRMQVDFYDHQPALAA